MPRQRLLAAEAETRDILFGIRSELGCCNSTEHGADQFYRDVRLRRRDPARLDLIRVVKRAPDSPAPMMAGKLP